MSRHYLNVPFAQKDPAKALGARFAGAVKRWYVEPGTDLVPFGAWLPAGAASAGDGSSDLALAGTAETGLALPKGGIPLSLLLGGVASAVKLLAA
jgi:exodeoxyribonuclease VII large subunit